MKYVRENWPRLLAVAVVAVLALGGYMHDPVVGSAMVAAPLLLGETASLGQVQELLEKQGRAWEEFKKTNDAAIATGKQETGEVKAKLATLNAELDRVLTALSAVESAQQRMLLNIGTESRGGVILTPDQEEYRKSFNTYLRRGNDAGLRDLERRAMSVGSDPDGGYTVLPDTSGRIVAKIFETSPIRQYANVQSISTDALEGPNDLNEGVIGGWVGETATRSETSTPQTGKWRIPTHEMYAEPRITQTLLDDSAVDVEAWLGGKVADKMGRTENTAFFTGTGVGQPRGLLTYSTAATADSSRAWGVFEHVGTGSSGSYGTAPNGSDKLVDLVHKVKAAYRNGSAFWMNRATLGTTRQLKDGVGNYIWLPSMTANQPSTLLGFPVVEAEDMPAIAASSLSVGFGNMNLTYQIVDRIGIRVLRDPFTAKPYIKFYTTRRVGGDVLHFESFKFLKFV